MLVEYGANVNHENNEGKTALIRALGVLKFETIKFLIEKGSNVNHTDNDARSFKEIKDILIPSIVDVKQNKHGSIAE